MALGRVVKKRSSSGSSLGRSCDIVMAYINIAYIVMAYIGMAYIGMACTGMAYVGMTYYLRPI